MKRLKWVTLSFALGLSWAPVQAHEIEKPKSYILQTQDPENVMNAMFYAARTGDLAILSVLCDPKGEGDMDTKGICALGTPSGDKKILPLFVKAFFNAKIIGKPDFGKANKAGKVEISIQFTDPKREQLMNEKMTLVQRYGNWYLLSF